MHKLLCIQGMSEIPAYDDLSAFECMFFGERHSHDFAEKFFCRIPVDVIVQLAQVNSRLRAIVDKFARQRWNIKEFLAEWFRDPTSFQARLGESDAVISGWQALQFFDSSLVIDGRQDLDLEIYLRLDGVAKMGRELMSQGFSFISTSEAFGEVFEMQVMTLAESFVHHSYQPYQLHTRTLWRFKFVRLIWNANGVLCRRSIEMIVVVIGHFV